MSATVVTVMPDDQPGSDSGSRTLRDDLRCWRPSPARPRRARGRHLAERGLDEPGEERDRADGRAARWRPSADGGADQRAGERISATIRMMNGIERATLTICRSTLFATVAGAGRPVGEDEQDAEREPERDGDQRRQPTIARVSRGRRPQQRRPLAQPVVAYRTAFRADDERAGDATVAEAPGQRAAIRAPTATAAASRSFDVVEQPQLGASSCSATSTRPSWGGRPVREPGVRRGELAERPGSITLPASSSAAESQIV